MSHICIGMLPKYSKIIKMNACCIRIQGRQHAGGLVFVDGRGRFSLLPRRPSRITLLLSLLLCCSRRIFDERRESTANCGRALAYGYHRMESEWALRTIGLSLWIPATKSSVEKQKSVGCSFTFFGACRPPSLVKKKFAVSSLLLGLQMLH
jgi:hypothetical protein